MVTDAQPIVIESRTQSCIVGTSQAYTMQTRHEIPAQWSAFFQAGYEIPDAKPGAMFGVSFAADGQGGFRYGVGVEVAATPDQTPDGTCVMLLSEGDYAVVRAFGPVAELPAQFDGLFSQWMPASEFVPREGAVFELYPDDPRNGPDGMAYEIWAPVVAK